MDRLEYRAEVVFLSHLWPWKPGAQEQDISPSQGRNVQVLPLRQNPETGHEVWAPAAKGIGVVFVFCVVVVVVVVSVLCVTAVVRGFCVVVGAGVVD